MKKSLHIGEDFDSFLRDAGIHDEVTATAIKRGLALREGQKSWIAGVQAGIEAADRGDFASEEDIALVLNKYRPLPNGSDT